MSETIKGRNCRVEVGLTYGSPKTVSAVTVADPAVASSTAHGLTDGSVGYCSAVQNMAPLDGQAVRVADGDADSFELEGIDASDWPAFAGGKFVPVATWGTLSQSTQYALGGGAPKTEDNGTLLDTDEVLEKIKNGAETVTIDLRALSEDNAALAACRKAARKGGDAGRLVFRITHDNGSQRIFRGAPSLPGETLAQGGLGSGQMTVTVKGQVCYLGPIA